MHHNFNTYVPRNMIQPTECELEYLPGSQPNQSVPWQNGVVLEYFARNMLIGQSNFHYTLQHFVLYKNCRPKFTCETD